MPEVFSSPTEVLQVSAGNWQAAALWRQLRKGVLSKQGLSLLDQAVVSGANFATTILIGRLAWQAELGTYWLGMTLVLLLIAAQNALISSPFTLFSRRRSTLTPAELVGVAVLHVSALAVLASVGFLVAGLVCGFWSLAPELSGMLFVLALVVPCLMLRELARRVSLARLNLKTVLAIDLGAAALQVGGLAWLGTHGQLAARSAFGMSGLACGVVGLCWLFLWRGQILPRRSHALQEFPRYWTLGKWELVDQLTVTANLYLVYWLLAALGGTSTTGVYAACMTIVSLANPFVFGMTNILSPRLAEAHDHANPHAVCRLVRTSSLILGGVVGLYCLLLIVGGEKVVTLCYGPLFAGQQWTIATCAIAAWLGVLGTSAAHGLWARERTDINFYASILGLVLTLLIAAPLYEHWGVLSATLGMIVGNAASTLVRVLAFRAIDRGWHQSRQSVTQQAAFRS